MSLEAVVILFTGFYALIQLFQPPRKLTTQEWMEPINAIYRDALKRLVDDDRA